MRSIGGCWAVGSVFGRDVLFVQWFRNCIV